jgi:hypothetical protein
MPTHSFVLSLATHALPIWFLVFSLFLPRIALAVSWLQGILVPFHLVGFIPLIIAIIVPRVLILWMIYTDQGVSLWFLIHLVAALLVWSGSGTYQTRRRSRREEVIG